MKLIKPVLWTVLGVVIGAAAVSTAREVQAQQSPSQRLVATPGGKLNLGSVSFLWDKKSGGCWIAATYDGTLTTVAVAPPSACH